MFHRPEPLKSNFRPHPNMSAPPSPHLATEAKSAEIEPEMAVIVISVGAPPELEAAIASILRQDIPVELVIVNSGGGDVRKWLPAGAEGVRIVESDTLWGPGTARNMGIEASRAPYVAFLAADCEALEGWVRHRLQHHRDGATAVASALVNSNPLSVVAWAYHLSLFAKRFPGTPANKAARYGGSYDRQLFVRHGLFEEIRVGEDTEFHSRIRRRKALKWVPEVRTVHRNVTSVTQAWKDQHRRGLRSGMYWPQNHKGAFMPRVRIRLSRIIKISRLSLTGRDRFMAMASYPLLAINLFIFERAANRGKAKPDPVASRDGKARSAARGDDWKTALKLWRKSDRLEPGRFAPMLGIAQCLMRLQRYGEAEEAYVRLRDAWPQLETAYLGIAAAAAETGAWEHVLEAWQAIARISPVKNPMPLHRIATTLLQLNRTEEAAEIACSLREDFPDLRAGFAVGAETALRTGDWKTGFAFLEHLVFGMADWCAVPKWAALLISQNRLEDARALWDRLTAAGAPIRVQLHAAGPYLSACHRWDDLIELFGKFAKAVRSDAALLQSHTTILALHGRLPDALRLIRRSQVGPPEWRSYLLTTTFLRAHATDEVLTRFRKIWQRRKITGLPWPLQAPIMAAAVREEGPEFAETLLDRLEAGSRTTRQAVIWSLTGIFQRERLRGLRALSRPVMASPPEVPLEVVVRNSLVARPEREQAAVLLDVCHRWQKSRQQHPAFFPDPCFVLSDAIAVADRIATAIDSKQPLSLVRLGDGEGNQLSYREEYRRFQVFDRLTTRRTWWAEDAPDHNNGGDEIQELLREAVTAADIVGIPDLQRVCRVLGIDRFHELSTHGKNSRGLIAALDFAADLPADRMITSCHIHEAFAYWGLWDLLIPRARRVSLITCHPQLGRNLSDHHGVTIGDVHLIPPERKYSANFQNSRTERHYPDTFLRLREKLASVGTGEVFLVAAGILGKSYCQWIKEAGGIALDIGSAADFWCGFGTRGFEELAGYHGPDGMTECYRQLADSDERIARLINGR